MGVRSHRYGVPCCNFGPRTGIWGMTCLVMLFQFCFYVIVHCLHVPCPIFSFSAPKKYRSIPCHQKERYESWKKERQLKTIIKFHKVYKPMNDSELTQTLVEFKNAKKDISIQTNI